MIAIYVEILELLGSVVIFWVRLVFPKLFDFLINSLTCKLNLSLCNYDCSPSINFVRW